MYINLSNNKRLFISLSNSKMGLIPSLSVSTLNNLFCQKMRQLDGVVCQKCYAWKIEKLYAKTYQALTNNDFLKYELLSKNDLLIITTYLNQFNYVRFNSFGEIETITQLRNYFNIAKMCRLSHFTLYTKNFKLLEKYLKTHRQPKNIKIILSSYFINKPLKRENLSNKLKHNNIFTVYDKNTQPTQHKKSVSCGKDCSKCMLCYLKNKDLYINEVIH